MKKKVWVVLPFLMGLFMFSFFLGDYSFAFTYLNPNSVIDISGLSNKNATALVQTEIENLKENLKIEFSFEEQTFLLKGSDLTSKTPEIVVKEAKEQVFGKGFFDKINIFKNRSKKVVINKADLFFGSEIFVNNLIEKVNRDMQEPSVVFSPNKKVMFDADDGVIGAKVNKEELKARIKENFFVLDGKTNSLAVPTTLTPPTLKKGDILKNIKKRASFSTNYSNSVGGRRHNVLISLDAFNGMVIKPDEVVSFNEVIDKKVPTSAYKVAKIIVNGEFVDGRGGGMCQASSTLYNAILLSDLDVLKSYSHSLPVGYVKFGFDAMVNPPGADLIFKNTTDQDVYIKTYGNNDDCFVEVYGKEMPKGLEIKRRSENIGTLKHPGDKIVPDTSGKFSDKILFKGEFHRIKYPQQGYEAKSYLEYWVNGEKVKEKYLRYSRYNAQQGIIYEGVEDLPEGLSYQEDIETMAYPLKQEQETVKNLTPDEIEEKTKKTNPSHYNP